MWPELTTLLSAEQLDKLDKNFQSELKAFITEEQLDSGFGLSFKSVYLPLAKWIASKHISSPVVIGLNGAQGSGKSTTSRLLSLILQHLFGKRVVHLSIDDLYYSKAQRRQLAQQVHPLLKTRGVPGTHNVELGVELFKSIKNATNTIISIPVFDKAIDDLLSESNWQQLDNSIDIVLFEGWCVGSVAQEANELNTPLNELEALSDSDMQWRTYVNQQLTQRYQGLFSYLDYLIMLKVPDMESVVKWRTLQETKLQQNLPDTAQTMSAGEIKRFIQYFERITRHSLKEMPGRADVVLEINPSHQISAVNVRSVAGGV